jgi:hypothetical protein
MHSLVSLEPFFAHNTRRLPSVQCNQTAARNQAWLAGTAAARRVDLLYGVVAMEAKKYVTTHEPPLCPWPDPLCFSGGSLPRRFVVVPRPGCYIHLHLFPLAASGEPAITIRYFPGAGETQAARAPAAALLLTGSYDYASFR